jgi:hypothetical protein
MISLDDQVKDDERGFRSRAYVEKEEFLDVFIP